MAKAAAGGHTLLLTPDTVVTVNPLVCRKTGFDARAQLVAVSILATTSQLLVCNAQTGIETVKQLVERGRQSAVTFAAGGAGTPGHLMQALLAEATGIRTSHIPYCGPPSALAALRGGEVQCGFLTTPTVLPHVRTGKLRALAISSPERWSLAPEVSPLSDQLGRHDADALLSNVLAAPKGTPAPTLTAIKAGGARSKTATSAPSSVPAWAAGCRPGVDIRYKHLSGPGVLQQLMN